MASRTRSLRRNEKDNTNKPTDGTNLAPKQPGVAPYATRRVVSEQNQRKTGVGQEEENG